MKNKKNIFFLLVTLVIVFGIYSFSLNREWQFFDEKGMYADERLFPIPYSFSEIFEIISQYAFNYNIDSQNAFFSNIVSVRSTLLGAVFNIFLLYFFKDNALYYHIFQISLHLLNTALVWFIFYKLLNIFKIEAGNTCIFSSLLALLWALHPANTEAVLLSTNWISVFTCTFCFGFFLFTLLKIADEKYSYSPLEIVLISVTFFLSILISEYSYTLPFILFFILLSFIYKKFGQIKTSLVYTFSLLLPYILGFLFFVGYYLTRSLLIVKDINVAGQFNNFSLERLLWLSPQIFCYFFKLFFYPKKLSLYQAVLLKLGNSTFDPYVIFTFIIFALFLFLPLALFLIKKSNPGKSYVFLLVYSFVFSLFPFLQIIAPTYCLMADRYCYFPLFTGLFFLTAVIHELPLQRFKKILPVILAAILLVLSTRTLIRIYYWKDSYSLYLSASKCSKNKLYKAKIYSILGYYFDLLKNKDEMVKYNNLSLIYAYDSIKELLGEKLNKQIHPPKTLKAYGLDINSQITTSAYIIANTRLSNFKEKAEEVIGFYEPFIKDNLENAGNSQIDLYAKVLIKTNQEEKAKEILESAHKKYPFSPTIIYTLSNLYLRNQDVENSG